MHEPIGVTAGLGPVEAGRRSLALSLHDVWFGYLGIGGCEPLRVVAGWLSGEETVAASEYDLLAQAVNDAALGRGEHAAVPYSDEV